MSEYVVVTGMSGAGRSTAGATLEDLGWFVIDNIPSSLIGKVAELAGGTGSETQRVAFVVGRGGGEGLDDVLPAIEALAIVGGLNSNLADPTGVFVAAWEGTVRAGPDGLSPS